MNGIKQINGKIYVVHHLKRELQGHMCVCEKNLAMECDRKKNPTCLTGMKKKCTKKIAQPSPQKFNGPSLTFLSVYMN